MDEDEQLVEIQLHGNDATGQCFEFKVSCISNGRECCTSLRDSNICIQALINCLHQAPGCLTQILKATREMQMGMAKQAKLRPKEVNPLDRLTNVRFSNESGLESPVGRSVILYLAAH